MVDTKTRIAYLQHYLSIGGALAEQAPQSQEKTEEDGFTQKLTRLIEAADSQPLVDSADELASLVDDWRSSPYRQPAEACEHCASPYCWGPGSLLGCGAAGRQTRRALVARHDLTDVWATLYPPEVYEKFCPPRCPTDDLGHEVPCSSCAHYH